MGAVTLTRGIGGRDDIFVPSTYTIDSGVTFTSDGDIGSLFGTTSSNGITQSGLAISSSIYSNLMIRALGSGTIDVLLTFSDATTQRFTLSLVLSWTTFTNTVTFGKTVTKIKFLNQSLTGTINLDFWMMFKEILQLPIITRPHELKMPRRQPVVSIPYKEGDNAQDLGSPSIIISVEGLIIATKTPNNYTAQQWVDVLQGVWLESNSAIDPNFGGPTWQWFVSDLISYKFSIADASFRTIPGRDKYAFDFTIRFRKTDVLSATAQTFGAIQ